MSVMDTVIVIATWALTNLKFNGENPSTLGSFLDAYPLEKKEPEKGTATSLQAASLPTRFRLSLAKKGRSER